MHLTMTREAVVPQGHLAATAARNSVVLLQHAIEDAVSSRVRVRRELTRRFFASNNDKVLIAFSCGVAELKGRGDALRCLERADDAHCTWQTTGYGEPRSSGLTRPT
ncbi:MAG: hypothetical protein IPM01_31605 [Burkholderiaceae bacterium]|nr:hypothetical protein [Burkholderiaceae bacterium]